MSVLCLVVTLLAAAPPEAPTAPAVAGPVAARPPIEALPDAIRCPTAPAPRDGGPFDAPLDLADVTESEGPDEETEAGTRVAGEGRGRVLSCRGRLEAGAGGAPGGAGRWPGLRRLRC